VSYVASHYLRNSLKLEGKVYLVGMAGFGRELELQGISYTGPGEDPVPLTQADMLETSLDPEVCAVVVGYDHHFNQMKLMKACSYLQRPNCHFIATNEDSCLPTTTHIRFPGTGCLVKAVSYGAGREPIVIGKPHPPIMNVIEESTQLDRTRTLMVGDRLNTDILFGRQNGLKTLLVMTGVTLQSDLETAPQEQLPDFYCQSIANVTCSPTK
jgi:phosphoglycolate/pyridoxal phosphate phosphatase family enzyme